MVSCIAEHITAPRPANHQAGPSLARGGSAIVITKSALSLQFVICECL